MSNRSVILGSVAAVLGVGVLALVGMQFIPWSIEANPPVTKGPDWDSPETKALAQRAGCMDCHSNETVYPWYSYVAPVGWLVVDHVADGRRHLNLSELDKPQRDADEAGEEVREGKMPPDYYVNLHPEAALTAAEKEALAAGLEATLRGVPEAKRGGGEEHADHDDD